MMNDHRKLTGKEKRQIKKLVISLCANYDKEYGCLPLDSDCYMFGICYRSSALCKYFRNAVLPTEPELEAVFSPQPMTVCRECGKKFPANGKRVYCSEACSEAARRKQTAARVRKHRQQHPTR
jgi:predicted nucleic acid-binding Zn ribbon protein